MEREKAGGSRQPGVPWVVEGARVRTQLEIHLTNKSGAPARDQLALQSPVPAEVRLRRAAADAAREALVDD